MSGQKSKQERFADLAFDFAKIIFGGAIIATILGLHYPPEWVIAISFILLIVCIVIGTILYKDKDKDDKDEKEKDDKHKKD